MNVSEKLTSTLTILLLLTQVVLSGFVIQRLNNINLTASAANNQPDIPMFVENVSVDDDPSLGPEDAPITIIGFSDYQCPFCAEAAPFIKQIMNENPGKIRFVLRDFPLEDIHPNAFKAAEAAHFANDQGKYWEMHDLLFNNQEELSENKFVELATQLQLDVTKFQQCLSTEKYADEVRHDLEEGRQYQVDATPTFFVNGNRVMGSSLELLQQAVSKSVSHGFTNEGG